MVSLLLLLVPIGAVEQQKPPVPPKRNVTKKVKRKKMPEIPVIRGTESLDQILKKQWEVLRDYILKEKDELPMEDAVRIYTRACERFATRPNGAVLAAARYSSKVIKPQFKDDADLLSLVEAVTHPAFPAIAALDLGDADGACFTRTTASLALAHAIAETSLQFLAVAPGTSLGAHGVERLFLACGNLKVLRVADCFVGDAGADAISRLLPRTSLDRLDISRNHIGPRAASKLRDVAVKANVALKLRGNARWLERSCAAIQSLGAVVSPFAGAFLVSEARRLDLDPGAVAACGLYALATTFFFVSTALPHIAEASASRPAQLPPLTKDTQRSTKHQMGDVILDTGARLATYLAIAGAHAPFLAFVDLGLPRNFGLFLWTTCTMGALLNVLTKKRQFHAPPSLRPPSLTTDKLPLVLLGGLVPFLRFASLRAALGSTSFKALVSALILALVATALDITPLCKPLAYLLHLVAAGLHYFCVLTALVWHFLPNQSGGASAGSPPMNGGSPASSTTVF